MATIPSFRQNNRLAPVGGSQIVDPREARSSGENLAQFGRAAQGFSNAVGEYMDRKREVDYALKTAEVKQKLMLKAQEAEVFAKTNPEAARDGSTAQRDFSSQFNDTRDELLDVEDRKLKARLMTVATQVEGSYRNKMLTYQIEKHNSFVLEKSQEVINDMSFQLQQDPTLIGEKLRDFDQMAASMPYTGSNHTKYIQSGKRSLVTAAIESFAYKGDFATARKMLNETDAGALYSTDERKKLTKELEQREVQEFNNRWNLEQRNRTRLRQERTDLQERTESKLFQALLEAETPQAQEEILKTAQSAFANQMISRAGYNALRTNQSGISSKQSLERKSQYTISYLKGKSFEQIKPQIIADMEAGLMSHKDGLDAIKTISAQAKREAIDPKYKAEKSNAKEYIKSAVTPTGMSAIGSFFRAEEKQQIVEINEMVIKLEAEGKSPMEAAREATARVLGVQELRSSIDPQINHINDSVENLQKYGQVVVKRYKKALSSGKLTPEIEKKTAQTLREIKARQEHLRQKKILDSIIKLERNKE